MEKKKYKAPRIEIIYLDNEISLALASSPPAGPNEIVEITPEFYKSDPYELKIG